MGDTAEEARTNSEVTFFYGHFYMDVTVLVDQQGLHISYVRTLDVVWTTYQERWMIGMDGERESGKSMMMMMMMRIRGKNSIEKKWCH